MERERDVHQQGENTKTKCACKGVLPGGIESWGERYSRQVHRLVAEAFIPNPNNYPQINHKNGIKNDNRLSNIEWCNNSMNQIHAYANGLNRRSEKAGRKKRPVILTHTTTGETRSFGSIADAARFLGKWSRAHICDALHNKRHCNTVKGYIVNYGMEVL